MQNVLPSRSCRPPPDDVPTRGTTPPKPFVAPPYSHTPWPPAGGRPAVATPAPPAASVRGAPAGGRPPRRTSTTLAGGSGRGGAPPPGRQPGRQAAGAAAAAAAVAAAGRGPRVGAAAGAPPRASAAARSRGAAVAAVADSSGGTLPVHLLKGDVVTADKAGDAAAVVRDAAGRAVLKCMTLPQMEDWVESIGQPRFRARQLWKWLYKTDKWAATFDEMTDLSKTFRAALADAAVVDALAIHGVHQAADGTRKITFRLPGETAGASAGIIESVLIPAAGRTTLCVSSQLGCALNCQFCLTAKMGLRRHLTVGEIVDQVVQTRRHFEAEAHISNVVFMGMGEPLHNIHAVLPAVETLLHADGLNMSHNKVTVSTSGLVPEIRRFARESKANLAVSLNASTDEVRSWIMPINRKYPLASLMGVLRDEFPRGSAGRTQAKVFFEYVMLRGVNDSLDDARRILRLTAGVPCKVNLIHFNVHDGSEFAPSDRVTMRTFQDFLVRKGMTVTIRESRGDDEMAACGQLGRPGDRPSPPRMRVPEAFEHAVDAAAVQAGSRRPRRGGGSSAAGKEDAAVATSTNT
ncbi:hypothetical protein I4F81_001392 [Pyropia yezoensis]|uniref:Uncharacterized protein n=1 Tax=Pyropia yezoensis TaxID=2788 RepID=A0ACC3BMR1_PYRYE|nr:hypothetical protein I4F81_001392 [Neopyropia yezoensis]